MKQWTTLSISEAAKLPVNQDYAVARTRSLHRYRIDALLVCDGVGGRPNGRECSVAVGTAALASALTFLSSRKSRTRLMRPDADMLGRKLSALPKCSAPQESATTLALVLFDRRARRNAHTLVVAWSGDSRVYVMNRSGVLLRLTADHVDEDGHLTRYFRGDGRAVGRPQVTCTSVDNPCAVFVTSDGVHDHCTDVELRDFILYCVDHRLQTPAALSEAFNHFLAHTMLDNYSIALVYTPLKTREVTRIVGLGALPNAHSISG